MSYIFNSICAVFDDETPLSQFLNEELRTKWAISKTQFTDPSWNILRRALMKFDLGGVDYPTDYLEVEILEQLTLLDVKQVKHAGKKRIENLITELSASSFVHADKSRELIDSKENHLDTNSELINNSSQEVSIQDFILTEILLTRNWREKFFDKFGFHFEYSIFEDESVARKISMLECRVNGKTLAEIGIQFDVTRERVRQILEKAFSQISSNPIFQAQSLSQILENQKESKHEEESRIFESKIRDLLDTNPGMKYEDLAESLSSDIQLVKSRISYQASKFVFQEQWTGTADPEFSDDFIIGAIKMAAAIRSPLSAPMYENLVERGLVKGPKSQTIAKRFGTWSNACLNAGVMYVRSVRGEYSKTWSEEEIHNFLIDFLKCKEFGVGVLSYDEWRGKFRVEAPSSGHIRNVFGSWIDAKNNCLSYMKNQNISCGLL